MKTKKTARLICLVLALTLLASLLAACGSSEPDPNAGVYNADTADMLGISISVADVYPDGFSIELKNGGKCRITVGEKSASGKWTLEGEAISISGGGVDMTGTLKGDTIRVENVMDSGVNMEFVKSAG